MNQDFTLDLRAARRKSGFRQIDCAHLMGVHETRISCLERGKREPSLRDICFLSMIFGRSFEGLFSSIFDEVRAELHCQLPTLPAPPKSLSKLRLKNRQKTIESLAKRLEDNLDAAYDD